MKGIDVISCQGNANRRHAANVNIFGIDVKDMRPSFMAPDLFFSSSLRCPPLNFPLSPVSS
ncbi:hypothetical protein KYK29_14660 [Shinella daejeonensis]|uniref:hypothetical protein n=1 Tax=Shinella daejeonensis TaxID=659017 RepID=UPI0020C7FE4F|nr:hypothetical protein [Shinella daejeonensis]MCP8896170.1 hypothetical protein [Shinella daejeonensis]